MSAPTSTDAASRGAAASREAPAGSAGRTGGIRKLAVWDIDGTLIDSRAGIARAMREAFEAEGLTPPGYEDTRRIVGLSLAPAIATLAPTLTPARRARLERAYSDAFVRHRAEDPAASDPLYEGALDTLRALRDAGWLMGVATGKSRRGLDIVMDKRALRVFFDVHFCADDARGKPHPQMVQLNLDALGAAPADAVMIGDTSYDMEMARAAGVCAQGVTWGFHTRAEIEAAGAAHVADSFAELGARLAAFARGDAQ
jgi:phosphoglycolate phosphatase